jgi:hypothetical protein
VCYSAYFQCFGSGSGLEPDSIRSVDPHLDPNFKFWRAGCSLLMAEGFFCSLDIVFGVNFQKPLIYCPKHWKLWHLWHCKTRTQYDCWEWEKKVRFLNINTVGVGMIRIWIGIKMESQIRTGIKTMPTQGTYTKRTSSYISSSYKMSSYKTSSYRTSRLQNVQVTSLQNVQLPYVMIG